MSRVDGHDGEGVLELDAFAVEPGVSSDVALGAVDVQENRTAEVAVAAQGAGRPVSDVNDAFVDIP